MIVLLDKFDLLNENQYGFLYKFLPDNQKKKVDLCYNQTEKFSKILEYYIVKKYLNFEGIKEFSYTANGKPYINNYKDFNISYDDGCLVVAFANNQVGVDVQKNIEYDEKLANYIANESELSKIQKAKNKSIELTKLWVKKESYIKCIGGGLNIELKNILKETKKFHFKEQTYRNYQICICVKCN